MEGSNPDEKILSYNDVVLRRSDLDILGGPYFLNDRIIEFYFSFLSSNQASQEVSLVPPSISFWIMNCPEIESLKDFVEPLELPSKKVVLFPVNNNEDLGAAEGGSHWSLGVYRKDSNTFAHHDSGGGANEREARRLYERVARFFSSSDDDDPAYVSSRDSGTLLQMNGYDCGLYVTAIARVVCLWWDRERDRGDYVEDLEEKVTPAKVSEMRKEILGLIRGLMVAK